MNTDKTYAENIASEYATKDGTKVQTLKKLDRKAKLPANLFTYTFGVVSALIFGLGLCLAMKVIGTGVGMMILGIVIGVIGMALMGINYPIYLKIKKHGMDKYSSQIVSLANEISNEAK